MKTLVLGAGGREHSLAWAIAQNPRSAGVVVAPGNAGMALADGIKCCPVDMLDTAAVLDLCYTQKIDLVVVGPEAPLVAGLADAVRKAGFLCIGPSQTAARLESSKSFTKDVCAKAGVPTAAAVAFRKTKPALAYLATLDSYPVVIKADGLAAGKGVVVADDEQTAQCAVQDMFAGRFGNAGHTILIEEFMQGLEASFFVLTDGRTVRSIGSAQDYKRAFDGDKGNNTGGMGAVSPTARMTDALQQSIVKDIIQPTLDELHWRGCAYCGVLYAGLMIDAGRPRLVEYNVRFGDPECQALMMRLGGQMLDLLLGAAEGHLDKVQAHFADDAAVTVVLAAQGYPQNPQTGIELHGLDVCPQDNNKHIFYAGVGAGTKGALVSTGGRVLNVTARADSVVAARSAAYDMVEHIANASGSGLFYRTDIAT